MKEMPNNLIEQKLREAGMICLAGVDEAGCGALAGPVVASAVILPVASHLSVCDSKLLTPKARDALFSGIIEEALAYGVGMVMADEIDRIGIRPATFLAMQQALQACQGVEHVLVDAWTIPKISTPQTGIIRGDRKERLIAAASIIAKVTRDRWMQKADVEYPAYGFDQHKGYGTLAHRQAIHGHGFSPIHRKTFTVK